MSLWINVYATIEGNQTYLLQVTDAGLIKELSPLVLALIPQAEVLLLNQPFWENPAWTMTSAPFMLALKQVRESRLPSCCTVAFQRRGATTPSSLELMLSTTDLLSQTRDSERRLKDAQQVAQLGSWEFELATGAISWSLETFRLFQLDPALGEPDYPTHLSRYHPEDRPIVAAAVEGAIRTGKSYNLELRVILAGGELRWLHCRGKAVYNDAGEVIRLLGTSQDITERKQREHVVFEMLELMPHIAFVVDDRGVVSYYNGYFYSFTGVSRQLPPAEIDWKDLLPAEELPRLRQLVANLPNYTEPFEIEFPLRRADGELRWHLMRAVPILEGSQVVERFVVTGTDISERRNQEQVLSQANSRLETLANTDALTGVANRHALDERLPVEWERAHRYQLPLSLILLDVDYFKSYNDTFGHYQGDEVLRRLGGLLIANVRKPDFVVRYGGEEFLVVLPHADREAAMSWAERVRGLIEVLPWPLRPVTASFGVATWTVDQKEQSLAMLLAEADRALYRAKVDRNCVRQDSPNK